ncbi:hypothetical protein T484DRAFT_1788804 [Baffinella frigidus]|nr:hypothetical protein T484DRAFT_1788804 [Cryptophyta sp. CCMP2293]
MDRFAKSPVAAEWPGHAQLTSAPVNASVALLTLHVGAGTFRPVVAEDAARHSMHAERIQASLDTLRAVRRMVSITAKS